MRLRWTWLLPLGIALAILWLSHQPTLPGGIELPHPFDKMVHACAFGALAFGLDLALRRNRPGMPIYHRHLLVFGVVSAFGALDEFHQSFVPGRDCNAGDWAADTLGAAFALALVTLPALWTRRLEVASWKRGQSARPDPNRPLILVADPHWSSGLTGLASATQAHPEADWLFLGDVFDVWVGLPGMETGLQQEFLAWVDARRAAGRWVGLWLGNREYFLDRFASRFDLMGEGIGGALPEEGLRFEHGDLINAQDWKYRIWNLASRSGPVWALARLLPATTAGRVARRLEEALRTTNTAYRLHFPRAAFRLAAEGSGTFLTGHFHERVEEGQGLALPWAHEGEFQVWKAGRIEPLLPSTASKL